MSLTLRTCSMGGSQTGLVGTIGVTILNADGTTQTARATADIYEIGGGCYGKELTFPDDFKGSIVWDTGGGSPVYAVEEFDSSQLDAIQTDLDTLTDARGEPGQGALPVSASTNLKIDYVYKILRNLKKTTATLIEIYNNDGDTVDHKMNISDDGTTYTENEIGSGP